MPRKPMPIRELFVNTGERSAGSAVPIWACRRCGWKLVDNATRFARHVLRCPSTQPGDRDLAQEHLASLGGANTAQLEAISANADEFGRAFTLEGKAQVRNLFEDTEQRRSGEKAKLFRCRRCGHETTENATRFSQHILKCEKATEDDRVIAREHQTLTAKRRELRQAKQDVPDGVAVKPKANARRKSKASCSSRPATVQSESAEQLCSLSSKTGSAEEPGTQDAMSQGASNVSRSASRTSLPHAALPDVRNETEPVPQGERDCRGVGVTFEPNSTMVHNEAAVGAPSTHAAPLVRGGGQDIINLDLLECLVDESFDEEFARLQQPLSAHGASGGRTVGDPTGTACRSRLPSGTFDQHCAAQTSQYYVTQPNSHPQPSHAQFSRDHSQGLPYHTECPETFTSNTQSRYDCHSSARGSHNHIWRENQGDGSLADLSNAVPFENYRDSAPLRMLPSSSHHVPDPHGNEYTALTPTHLKRQRGNRGEALEADTVSISMDEYQQWKQWKEHCELPKIIQVPDMEYTMFQNLYSFFISHAMNCANVYISHGGGLGPSCNTAMIAQAISKDWSSLASVYKTMVQCCARAQARFILEKASTCPERVAAIYNSTLAIAQDCLCSGIGGALSKWSQFTHLDKNQLACYRGLEKAFQHMTLADDGTYRDADPKSEGVIISLQQFTVTYGPYLRSLYLSNKNNQLVAGNSTGTSAQDQQDPHSTQFHCSVPCERTTGPGTSEQGTVAISHGEFSNWHEQATAFSPLMDEIASDVRTSIAVTSYMTELYSVAGWDLVLII